MENKFKTKELEGINIYRDRKNQKVYLDPITKNGYVITPEKEKTFKTYSNVVLFAVLSAIFANMIFEFKWYICIIIGIAVFAFLEWRFRKFLDNCTMYKSFKPDKKNKPEAYDAPASLITIKSILYIVLGILFIITVVLNYKQGDRLLNGVCICCAFGCLFIGVRYILVLVSRKKNS